MTRRTMALLGGAAAFLVLAAGCATEIAGTPSAAGPAVTTTPKTATPPPPATSSTAPPTTQEPVGSGACTVRDLSLSLGESDGATGTVYRALVFTNTGARTCTVQGFPGVSYVAGEDGHQVGEAAFREGAKGAAVTLGPGAAAAAPVGFVNVDLFEPAVCQPTPVRGLRVYPPHDTKSAFVPFETMGCAGDPPSWQLTVRTVHEGTSLG